ncbi:MAG TPA: TIGR01777 family oxidoreductase [Candidatus Acidoferrales bacterium]|nr:TIGR01777 family oxidoreductase [Candidatus Acidoferrales bacterium]
MKILISGSTGLVGSAVVDHLSHQGHAITRLVRAGTRLRSKVRTARELPQVPWNPQSGILNSRAADIDAVIHLAGASIAGRRWTPAWKRELRDSRIMATRNLIASLRQLQRPPQVFIAASAIGYYGDRGEEELTESSDPGGDFLAQLTTDWEAESARASEFGARVVILRFGIILAREGGALPRIALPFRLGFGGKVGSGSQWMSWIALDDIVAIVSFALEANLLSGPANAVSPNPVRNAEFSSKLGRVLRRPAILPTPAFVLRMALGEMADALLLASQKVYPQKLQSLGYRFLYADLESALTAVLQTAH